MGLHRLESGPFVRRTLHPLLVMITMTLLLAAPVRANEHEGSDDETGRRADPHQFRPVGNGADHSLAGEPIGERPALLHHMDQGDIDSGRVGLNELLLHGQAVFEAQWNTLDGVGRPLTNASSLPRNRPKLQFRKATAAGPDAGSCLACHGQPRSGGAADRGLNLFLGFSLADQFIDANGDPVPGGLSLDFSHCNERNPPSIFGDGPLEVASREMSFALMAIRDAAKAEAASSGQPVTKDLVAKGVSFGKITALPSGKIDPSKIEGIDWDLIVKPFGWAGTSVSTRGNATGGMNLHFGMQPREKFGRNTDPDGDGVTDELTCGDMTAETVFMAALSPPGQVINGSPARRSAIARGKQIFDASSCTACHTPKMYIDNPVYTEPGPFNQKAAMLFVGTESPEGSADNSAPFSVAKPFAFDMTREGSRPRIDRTSDGKGVIEAYTDMKRHVISDNESPETALFANEQRPRGSLAGQAAATDFTVAPPVLATNAFITSKLWGIGSSAPYGHRGDLTTITDNIKAHGGEAKASRLAFFAMPQADQNAVIEFLRSLQIVPDGGPRIVKDNGN
jgi:hypothetical protein